MSPDHLYYQAVTAFIVNPKLTKAPVYETPKLQHTTTFKSAALKSAYDELRSGSSDTVGNANLTWGEFVTSDGEHFVSAQVFVPAGGAVAPGQKVTSFAVIEDKAGQIVDVREDDTTAIASGSDAYIDRSLELDAGTYKATFGMAADEKSWPPRASDDDRRARSEGHRHVADAAGQRSLSAADRASGKRSVTFGGRKSCRKATRTSRAATSGTSSSCVIGRPTPAFPNVRVRIDIKERRMPEAGRAEDASERHQRRKLADRPLRPRPRLRLGFKPGDYTMKVHVVDVVLGKEYDFEKPFKIRIKTEECWG